MTIAPTELATRLRAPKPPKLLDVRNPEEHEFVSLPGARLIPLGELMERVDELEEWREEDVVVYCHHGIRSAHAIAFLRTVGFHRLWNLSGGIDRYSEQVDPGLRRY